MSLYKSKNVYYSEHAVKRLPFSKQDNNDTTIRMKPDMYSSVRLPGLDQYKTDDLQNIYKNGALL